LGIATTPSDRGGDSKISSASGNFISLIVVYSLVLLAHFSLGSDTPLQHLSNLAEIFSETLLYMIAFMIIMD
jgi:hypothetical protein